MINEKIREAIKQYVEDEGLEEEDLPLLFENSSFDNSIVGISHDGRIVYNYRQMIEEYAAENECSEEEAQEWIDYNTLRALPYAGGKAPIIMYDLVSDISETHNGITFN